MPKGSQGVTLGVEGSRLGGQEEGCQRAEPENGENGARGRGPRERAEVLPSPSPAWPAASLYYLGHSRHWAKPCTLPPAVSQRANIYCPWKKKKKESPFRIRVWELLLRLAGAPRWPEVTRSSTKTGRGWRREAGTRAGLGGEGSWPARAVGRGGSGPRPISPRDPQNRSEGGGTLSRWQEV